MAWFANFYEPMIRPLEAAVFRKIRKEIAGRAEGHVLEVGSGTGLNFAHYIHATHVAAIEPDEEMAKQSLGKIREAPVPITLYAASAEALPFPDHSFDAVVATLVFCTIPDPKLAFQELGRTAKPGARLFLFEHVEMPGRRMANLQRTMTPAWSKVAGGCRLDRRSVAMAEQAGFRMIRSRSFARGLFVVAEFIND
ncbi:class I SAM-dependent methyltransferase [Bhargavaea beijingensis]|nr:class I SAM-dependent methyltransferase [Bhargavaea beijingensis]